MEQKSAFRNLTGTVCVFGLAFSSMNVNSTVVVNTSLKYPNPIFDFYIILPGEIKHRQVSQHEVDAKTILEADAKDLFGEMRDATPIENQGITNYVNSISKDTGVNFFDIC